MAKSLAVGLQDEIKRNYELKQDFLSIGEAGAFGAAQIQNDLDLAHRALQTGNLLMMCQAYEKLRKNKS